MKKNSSPGKNKPEKTNCLLVEESGYNIKMYPHCGRKNTENEVVCVYSLGRNCLQCNEPKSKLQNNTYHKTQFKIYVYILG
jgi:hypothetical protein